MDRCGGGYRAHAGGPQGTAMGAAMVAAAEEGLAHAMPRAAAGAPAQPLINVNAFCHRSGGGGCKPTFSLHGRGRQTSVETLSTPCKAAEPQLQRVLLLTARRLQGHPLVTPISIFLWHGELQAISHAVRGHLRPRQLPTLIFAMQKGPPVLGRMHSAIQLPPGWWGTLGAGTAWRTPCSPGSAVIDP